MFEAFPAKVVRRGTIDHRLSGGPFGRTLLEFDEIGPTSVRARGECQGWTTEGD